MISVWNALDESVGMEISCGKAPGRPPGVSNAVFMKLAAEVATRLVEPLRARAVMRTLVESWSPDWATFSSAKWRTQQGWTPGPNPVAGWMTYVQGERAGRRSPLPDGVIAESVGDGLLLIAAPTAWQVDGFQLRHVRDYVALLTAGPASSHSNRTDS